MTRTTILRAFPVRTIVTALACFSIAAGVAADPAPRSERPASLVSMKHGGNDFSYILFNGKPRWANNIADFYYNPSGQPYSISTEMMVTAIARAALKWSEVCNIGFRFVGLTTRPPDISTQNINQADGINTIGWLPLAGSLYGADAFTLLWSYNERGVEVIYDADMALNTIALPPFSAARLDDLDGLLTQQMGHFIGIAPSDDPTSILYAWPFHSYNYMRTLRRDDVNACSELYGLSALSRINRVFNWAEVTFPELFSPPGRLTEQLFGFNARYFEKTESAVGEQNGMLYVVLPGGEGGIIPVGTVDDLFAQAVMQGF